MTTKEKKLNIIIKEINLKLKSVPFCETIGLLILKKLAKKLTGGHYTIFKFTNNFGVMLGTPYDREDIEKSFKGETLKDALENLLISFNIEIL